MKVQAPSVAPKTRVENTDNASSTSVAKPTSPSTTTSTTSSGTPSPANGTTPSSTTANAETTSFQRGASPTAVDVDRRTLGQSSTTMAPTDPALRTQLQAQQLAAGTARHGAGVRDSGFGLNNSDDSRLSARGRIPAASWDNPAELVGSLTQNPATGTNATSPYRCAPANLLGAALMNGPEAAAGMLERVASSTPQSRLTAAEGQEMQQIAGRIRGRTATYEDLSRAQGLLYQAGNTRGDVVGAMDQALAAGRLNAAQRTQLQTYRTQMDTGQFMEADRPRLDALLTRGLGQPTSVSLVDDPQHPGDAARQHYAVSVGGAMRTGENSGYDDTEVSGLASAGGVGTGTGSVDYDVVHPLQERLQTLQPGESVTLRVQGQDSERGGDEFAAPDHFVTIGRRPDGTAYLYNPDPARGDHTLFTGRPGATQPANFNDELASYERRLSYDSDGDQPLTTGARF